MFKLMDLPPRTVVIKKKLNDILNNLYKTGQVFVYRSEAAVTPEIKKFMKAMANDIRIDLPITESNVIPWRYNFFNPLNIDVKNGDISMFLGRRTHELSANSFFDNFKDIYPKELELNRTSRFTCDLFRS